MWVVLVFVDRQGPTAVAAPPGAPAPPALRPTGLTAVPLPGLTGTSRRPGLFLGVRGLGLGGAGKGGGGDHDYTQILGQGRILRTHTHTI